MKKFFNIKQKKSRIYKFKENEQNSAESRIEYSKRLYSYKFTNLSRFEVL